MEIVESNSEGANVLLTRYDLAIIANSLEDIHHHLLPSEIEERVGCNPIEVKRLLDKFSHLYEVVMKASS